MMISRVLKDSLRPFRLPCTSDRIAYLISTSFLLIFYLYSIEAYVAIFYNAFRNLCVENGVLNTVRLPHKIIWRPVTI
jgi:hypothetical protein